MPRKVGALAESTLVISRVSFALVIYLILEALLPNRKFNAIVLSVLLAGIINQSNMFQNLKKYVAGTVQRGQFSVEVDEKRGNLVAALFDIDQYVKNGGNWNDRRRILFKKMSNQQQALVNSVKYPQKLNTVDKLMGKNSTVLQKIASLAKSKHNVQDAEVMLMKDTKRNNYFQVVESLCHFARDWSPAHADEVDPLLAYIKKQTKDLDTKTTTVIVPGSGLGRVSYELAKQGFYSVHSVEYSWLMVLLNEYMFTGNKDNIYPYLHTYSNHAKNVDQFRSVDIVGMPTKPENLHIHQGDFNEFTLAAETDNVVIVTCFFMDTAENMMDYIDSINRLCAGHKGTKRWVNVGPLKYGTAAQVEFSDEELKAVIKLSGWRLTDQQPPQLLGYLTDKQGLWQGYYNVLKWTAEQQ